MPDQTENHGYKIPREGEQNWDEPLNENFERYDTDIELRAPESELGEYEPKAGAKFLATDTGEVYIGDGSSWTGIRSTGPAPVVESLGVANTAVADDLDVTNGVTAGYVETDSVVTGTAIVERMNIDGSNLGIGSIRKDVPVDIQGQNNWDLSSGDGDVRVGDTDNRLAIGVALAGGGAGTTRLWAKGNRSQLRLGAGDAGDLITARGGQGLVTVGDPSRGAVTEAELFGVRSSTEGFGGMYVDSDDESGGKPFYGYATGGETEVYHYYDADSGSWVLSMPDGIVQVASDGTLSASAKNFVQTVSTPEGEREVTYTSVESDTPHTETSGVARLEDGHAEVALPEHFAWVTSDEEPLVVQVTPYGGSAGLRVIERSPERVVVEDLAEEGDYEFAYTVRGTREGHADAQVVSDPDGGAPAPADD